MLIKGTVNHERILQYLIRQKSLDVFYGLVTEDVFRKVTKGEVSADVYRVSRVQFLAWEYGLFEEDSRLKGVMSQEYFGIVSNGESIAKKGGIDLTPANMNLQTQNNGNGEIKFKIDPVMLQQLQNAPGFIPVIINIQPMTDIRLFLGVPAN